MNLKRYSDKLPVYVSAGILISGMFWFLREDEHIRGEDVAEVSAAVVERSVAFMTGPMTWSTTSAVQVVVTDDTSGGRIFWDGENPFEFNQDNWNVYRVDFFIRAFNTVSVGAYAEFGFLIDGEFDSGRIRVAIGKDPPGGSVGFGALQAKESRLRMYPGENCQVPLRMKAPPLRVVSGAPDRVDISPAIVKETAWCELIRELRTLFQKSQLRTTLPGETGIWWIKPDSEFDSKYASQSGDGYMMFDQPAYVRYQTNSPSSDGWPFDPLSGFTCGVVWVESGYPHSVAPAVRTPKIYSLNSVYVPDPPLNNILVISGAYGWDPGSEELILPGSAPYTSLFVPLASSLPGSELVYAGRTAASNAVDLSGFPWLETGGSWNSGEYFGGLAWNVLWALPTPTFDRVELGTNAVEGTDFYRIRSPTNAFGGDRTGPNVNVRSVAEAMNQTIAVTPALVEYAGGDNPTVRTTKKWELYREWHSDPFTTYDTNIINVVTTEVAEVTELMDLAPRLSVDAFRHSGIGPSLETPPAEAFRYAWSNAVNAWVFAYSYPFGSGSYTPSESSGGSYGHFATTVGLSNLYTAYPSEYALTNGMVSRVRVYAVFDATKFSGDDYPWGASSPAPYPSAKSGTSASATTVYHLWDLPHYSTNGLPFMSYTDTESVVVDQSGYTFTKRAAPGDFTGLLGLGTDLPGLAVPDYWGAPDGMTIDDSAGARRLDYLRGDDRAGAVKALRFTKVLDLSDPVSYPVRFDINIGASAPVGQLTEFSSWDFSCAADKVLTWGGYYLKLDSSDPDVVTLVLTDGDYIHTESDEVKQFSSQLTMVGMRVVVVVDWNFKHLVSTPYEPDPYTPEWLSPNSP